MGEISKFIETVEITSLTNTQARPSVQTMMFRILLSSVQVQLYDET